MNTARQLFLACLLVFSTVVKGADLPIAERIKPDRFGIIFNKGYAGDNLPSDPAEFEKLIVAIKKANFNVVLCKYDAKRLEICTKHDVQMFVDLLVEDQHVFKNPAKAQEVCESIKDSKAVYGYHLWSDNIGKTYTGRTRDVQNVHQWDPHHAAYIGSYKMGGVAAVQDMDLFGYYDFHFKRGGHWGHLNQAWAVAKPRGIGFLRYDDASPGLVGKGNSYRVGYSIATSIVFGLRGYMFHYVRRQIDFKTFELDDLGKDLARVNERFTAVGPELVKIEIPSAVYSTPITKTERNDPITGDPIVPGGLTPVPVDGWFKIQSGEVLVSESLDGSGRSVLIFACHNPYENQKVVVAFSNGIKSAEIFDRARKEWRPLTMEKGTVNFTIEDFGVELLRVQR